MCSPSARSAASEPDTTKPVPGDSPKSWRSSSPASPLDRAEVERRADPAGQAALGDRDEEAALGDVVGARQRAGADGVADRLLGRAHGGDVDRRQADGQLLAAQLGQLGAGQRRPERAREADRVAGAREAASARRARRRAARRRSRRPAWGRSARRRSRCTATRCRRRRACPAPGRRRPARGSTRSAARRCAASRGCRSSGSSSGRAARRRRRRGSPCTPAPPRSCPCTDRTPPAGPSRRSRPRSRAATRGSASTAASACSGRRTVRDCTMQSYC